MICTQKPNLITTIQKKSFSVLISTHIKTFRVSRDTLLMKFQKYHFKRMLSSKAVTIFGSLPTLQYDLCSLRGAVCACVLACPGAQANWCVPQLAYSLCTVQSTVYSAHCAVNYVQLTVFSGADLQKVTRGAGAAQRNV